MSIRPFDWRDLPTLHRYRGQGLFLDSTLWLTRRPSLVPTGALLSYFAPATGIFTFVSDEENSHAFIVGQIAHTAGAAAARVSFLAPESALGQSDLSTLFDRMAHTVGERGAWNILSEVDESHPAFGMLRKMGFAIYARQRIWEIASPDKGSPPPGAWRPVVERDALAVRSLYAGLTPGLVQQIESPVSTRPHGLVCYQNADLLGYVELKIGPRGVLAQPFIDPNAEWLAQSLPGILSALPESKGKPVYVCIRSYQSWLDAHLGPAQTLRAISQAVMVKRLAIPRRAEQTFTIPAIEGTRPEPTAPIARIQKKNL